MNMFLMIPTRGINQGGTVTYVCLQLTYYMGFGRIGLVGCDHTFATKGPTKKVVESQNTDPNHFNDRHFSNGVQWQQQDLVATEFHYQIADVMYRANNREIVNCADGGKLEIFERAPLDQFIDMNG